MPKDHQYSIDSVDVTDPLALVRAIGAISTDRAMTDDAWNEVDSYASILETLLTENKYSVKAH